MTREKDFGYITRKGWGSIVIVALLAVAGCAKTLEAPPPVDILAICQTRVAIVNSFAALEESDALGESVAARVDDLVTTTGPLCETPTEPMTNQAVLMQLVNGVAELTRIYLEASDGE